MYSPVLLLILQIKGSSVELLNDAGNEYSSGTKLHFQIRLRAKDYKGKMALHTAAQNIADAVQEADFPSRLIAQLDSAATPYDKGKISRFGWLFDEDIEVLNAIAMPIGADRDPFAEKEPEGMSLQNKANLTLLGVAMAAVAVLVFVLFVHYRLRQQHALWEKDKGNLGQGGQALTRMWNKFASIASQRGVLQQGSSLSSMSKSRHAQELEMSNMGLLKEEDGEEEEFFTESA